MNRKFLALTGAVLGKIAELTLRLSCKIQNARFRVQFRPTMSSFDEQIEIINGNVGDFEKLCLRHVLNATDVDRLLHLGSDVMREFEMSALHDASADPHYWPNQDKALVIRERMVQIRSAVRLAILTSSKGRVQEDDFRVDPFTGKAAACFLDLIAYRNSTIGYPTTRDPSNEMFTILNSFGCFTLDEIVQLEAQYGFRRTTKDFVKPSSPEGTCHVS